MIEYFYQQIFISIFAHWSPLVRHAFYRLLLYRFVEKLYRNEDRLQTP